VTNGPAQPPWAAELDAQVAAAVRPGSTLREVADRIRSQSGVRSATLREGLVKTDPPIVELLVEYEVDPGQHATRVHDLILAPDGTVTWAGDHPA